jgi:hypothetical protein
LIAEIPPFSLIDALYLLVDAKSQQEVINAGKRIEVLMRVGRGRQDFPTEVTERVIKATASTGLLTLASDLLRRMLSSDDVLPSPIAYTAVLNALRKNGRVSQMEEVLAEVGKSCRKHNQQLQSEEDTTKEIVGVDIVAFNSFIAALCDKAVNSIESSGSDTNLEVVADKNITEVTTPSEKYLYKALNLLRGDSARKRFALLEDPDIYSYNTILSACAKCSKTKGSKGYLGCIVDGCLREMQQRGVKADAFTYNARIEIALREKSSESDIIGLIDEAISHVEIVDRYTINLALVPLLRAGRRVELMTMLRNFSASNSGNRKVVAMAFEAFLNTLVESELDFAREVFDEFFLGGKPQKQRTNHMQLSREIQVIPNQLNSSWLNRNARGDSMKPHLIEPTTRHFNMLLGGYSKLFRSLGFHRRRTDTSVENEFDISRETSISLSHKVCSVGV